MATARLPVSGLVVEVGPPTGTDDLLLADASEVGLPLALALLAGVARPVEPGEVDWGSMSLTDIDALVLHLRRLVFGDVLRADVACPVAGCGEPIEVGFRIAEYLAFYRPRSVRAVEPADEAGWFRLRDAPVAFRLPVGHDVLAIVGHDRPERELRRRCLRPSDPPTRLRRRVERMMEALAPALDREIAGHCPVCGAALAIPFDPVTFCLRELRGQALFVYDDVHTLASAYHWTEDLILALPSRRRSEYAERVRADWRRGQAWQA